MVVHLGSPWTGGQSFVHHLISYIIDLLDASDVAPSHGRPGPSYVAPNFEVSANVVTLCSEMRVTSPATDVYVSLLYMCS